MHPLGPAETGSHLGKELTQKLRLVVSLNPGKGWGEKERGEGGGGAMREGKGRGVQEALTHGNNINQLPKLVKSIVS